MPFLPPNQQHQITEGNKKIAGLGCAKVLEIAGKSPGCWNFF